MMWLMAGVFLGIASIWDVKSMRIPIWFLWLGLFSSLVSGAYTIFSGREIWNQWLAGGIPGGISLLLSLGTREQIGYGDGVVLLTVGWMLGVKAGVLISILGLACSFLVSVGVLVCKRGNRSTRLPFVPFLMVGYMLVLGGKLL